MALFPPAETSDGGLSHVSLKSQPAGGLPFLFIDRPATKRCKGCAGKFPLDRFAYHATNRDRLKKFCRACTNKKQRPAAKRWYDANRKKAHAMVVSWNKRNPDKIAAYKEKHRAIVRAYARNKTIEKQKANNPNWPNPPTCPIHGGHPDWKNNRGQFFCRKCSKDKHAAANLRSAIKSVARKCGPEFAAEYAKLCESPDFLKFGGTKRIFEVKRHVFLRDFGLKVDLDISKRIGLMNRINGQSFHAFSIGWKCASCPLTSRDPRCFDIDHIIARAHGGTNAISNYQILCPNCHRVKSLADNAKTRSLKLSAQDKSTCQHSLCPPASAYDIPAVKQGNRDQPGSRPVSGETSQCITAASLPGSSGSQTCNTSHTPSTFAAPTQSLSTADAGGPVATPVTTGI